MEIFGHPYPTFTLKYEWASFIFKPCEYKQIEHPFRAYPYGLFPLYITSTIFIVAIPTDRPYLTQFSLHLKQQPDQVYIVCHSFASI